MKKILRIVFIVLGVALLAAQAFHPDRTNPTVDATHTIQAAGDVPHHIDAILQRSCSDCHSSTTRWPWYSNISPISWFVADHVRDARRHLSFSNWGTYSPGQRNHKAEEICHEVKEGEMPLKSYVPLHPSARLTTADRQALCEWANGLRGKYPPEKKTS